MKAQRGESSKEEIFVASKGGFDTSKARSDLHNNAAQGEAASADTVATKTYPPEPEKFIDGKYTKQQIFNVNETGLFWKKCHPELLLQKKRNLCPDSKLLRIGLHFV
jgi:hypothetical protein